jgi:hypothetical protein
MILKRYEIGQKFKCLNDITFIKSCGIDISNVNTYKNYNATIVRADEFEDTMYYEVLLTIGDKRITLIICRGNVPDTFIEEE